MPSSQGLEGGTIREQLAQALERAFWWETQTALGHPPPGVDALRTHTARLGRLYQTLGVEAARAVYREVALAFRAETGRCECCGKPATRCPGGVAP